MWRGEALYLAHLFCFLDSASWEGTNLFSPPSCIQHVDQYLGGAGHGDTDPREINIQLQAQQDKAFVYQDFYSTANCWPLQKKKKCWRKKLQNVMRWRLYISWEPELVITWGFRILWDGMSALCLRQWRVCVAHPPVRLHAEQQSEDLGLHLYPRSASPWPWVNFLPSSKYHSLFICVITNLNYVMLRVSTTSYVLGFFILIT